MLGAAAVDKPGPATPSTARNVKNVAKHMGVSDFGIKHVPAGGAHAGAKYEVGGNGAKQFVNIPHGSSEATIAHELGHVKNLKRFGLNYHALNGASRKLSLPGFAAAGMYSAGKEDPTYKAGLIHAGITAPMMGEELSANYQAVKHMTKRYGLLKGLGKSKSLAPAMGTYAVVGTAPLAITAIRKRMKAKTEQQAKTASLKKLKKKLSGELTLDRDQFQKTLEDAPKTPPRGPHPALNY